LDEFRREFGGELSSIRLPNLGELAAGLVAAVSIVLFAGAVVYWIRLDHAGLPRSQALTVVPREALIVVGAKELAVPLGIALLIYLISRPMGNIDRRRAAIRGGSSRWNIATGGEWVVAGFYGFAFFSLTSLSWGVQAVWIALTFLFFAYVVHRQIGMTMGTLLVVGAIIATGNCITREIDSPIKLDRATAIFTDGHRVKGLLVADTGSTVTLGRNRNLVSAPRAAVEVLVVGHPPPSPPRPDSLGRMATDAIGRLLP
jgi:hypothetical protein